jgi:hypothetical protein
MRILHSLAKEEGKTIITSIHQPNSGVFFAFDKLMLLADGNVVYFGTPNGSLDHVRELGLPCPEGYNAADHHMDLLVVDSAIEDGIDNYEGSDEFRENISTESHTTNGSQKKRQITGTTTKQMMIDSWDADASATQIEEEAAEAMARVNGSTIDNSFKSRLSLRGTLRNQSSSRDSIVYNEKSFNSTWWTQYTVLVHRSMKNSRSAIFTRLNLIKAGAIGFMAGLLWFQMPYTEATVYDRSSYYFFTMTFWYVI